MIFRQRYQDKSYVTVNEFEKTLPLNIVTYGKAIYCHPFHQVNFSICICKCRSLTW